VVDSLTIVASRLSPLEDFKERRSVIELLYKPSILNNVTNWKVFEGDEQILEFLTNCKKIKDLAINDEKFHASLE